MDRMNTGVEIMNIYRSINNRFRMLKRERFKHLNLTGTQGMLLGIVKHHGPMKISDLSVHMSLSSSTVSEIVSRMEKADLVVRERDEKDRRIVRVDLSEQFRKRARDHHGYFEKFANDLFIDVPNEEIEMILSGLKALDRLFESKTQKDGEAFDHDEVD